MTDLLGLTKAAVPPVDLPKPPGEGNSPFPSDKEAAEFAPILGHDTGNTTFLEGKQGREYRSPVKADLGEAINRVSYDADPIHKASVSLDYAKAEIAKHRSAIATLGYDPNKVTMEKTRLNIGGAYDKETDRTMWVSGEPNTSSVLIHEAIHRGFKKLAANDEAASIIKKGVTEEMYVRYIMATKMGDPENRPDHPVSVEQRNEATQLFGKYDFLRKDLQRLEEIAADMVKEKRPGGPR